MNLFRMNGVPIRHERQFCRHFSPTDLLRRRELAAGFAIQALKPMSLPANYHASQLYRAVFQELPDSIQNWTDYQIPFPTGEKEDALLSGLWELLIGPDHPSSHQIRRFWILAAGYLLAGKTLEEVPLTRHEADAAYDQIPIPEGEDGFPSIPSTGPILIPARVEPYSLVLDSDKAKPLLAQGSYITPRKLIAALHPQGDRTIPVTLEVFDHPGDPNPRLVTLPAGEYLYCNFVEEIPVFLPSAQAAMGEVNMLRQQDTITLQAPGQPPVTIGCAGQDILSFFPEEDGEHWIILGVEKLDYHRYSLRDSHRTKLRWTKHIVEIALKENNVLWMLNDEGHLISTDHYSPAQAAPFPRLSDIPRETGGN